jgi:hypothetical protein
MQMTLKNWVFQKFPLHLGLAQPESVKRPFGNLIEISQAMYPQIKMIISSVFTFLLKIRVNFR